MTKEIIYTALAVLLILGFVAIACIKHELTTRTINDETYIEAGVMTFNDNGNEIFIPIFRKAK